MLPDSFLPIAAALAIAAPGAAFVVLGAAMLLGRTPEERPISRLTAAATLLSLVSATLCAAAVILGPNQELVVDLGDWFAVPGYAFPVRLLVDRLSAPMMLLSSLICALIARFSTTYMHRDIGFARFFLLLLLFAAAMQLLISGGSLDLLFAGWELVGLSSVLLIAFFWGRKGPVSSGLRALITYRACDIGLLLGAALLHHHARSAEFDVAFGPGPVHWPLATAHLSHGAATLIALLLVLASLGKSAQVPLTGWLPRAMEGPTPSSALFYGALSVHAGAYLLLRSAPLLRESPEASLVLVVIGLVTALHGALTGRVQPDAKNALAYATVTQVGLIFAEIGLGWYRLAEFHMLGHICVRTFQLLRAPSLIHEMHQLHAAAGDLHLHSPSLLGRILPERLQVRLYQLSLERFHLDALLDRLAVRPVLALSRFLDALDRRWTALFLGRAAKLAELPHLPLMRPEPEPLEPRQPLQVRR